MICACRNVALVGIFPCTFALARHYPCTDVVKLVNVHVYLYVRKYAHMSKISKKCMLMLILCGNEEIGVLLWVQISQPYVHAVHAQ